MSRKTDSQKGMTGIRTGQTRRKIRLKGRTEVKDIQKRRTDRRERTTRRHILYTVQA